MCDFHDIKNIKPWVSTNCQTNPKRVNPMPEHQLQVQRKETISIKKYRKFRRKILGSKKSTNNDHPSNRKVGESVRTKIKVTTRSIWEAQNRDSHIKKVWRNQNSILKWVFCFPLFPLRRLPQVKIRSLSYNMLTGANFPQPDDKLKPKLHFTQLPSPFPQYYLFNDIVSLC